MDSHSETEWTSHKVGERKQGWSWCIQHTWCYPSTALAAILTDCALSLRTYIWHCHATESHAFWLVHISMSVKCCHWKQPTAILYQFLIFSPLWLYWQHKDWIFLNKTNKLKSCWFEHHLLKNHGRNSGKFYYFYCMVRIHRQRESFGDILFIWWHFVPDGLVWCCLLFSSGYASLFLSPPHPP